MKRILFVAAVLFLSIPAFAVVTTCANKTTPIASIIVADIPPAAVLNSFNLVFGNVPVRQWKRGNNREWIAVFVNNNRLWQASFTINGTLIKSGTAF